MRYDIIVVAGYVTRLARMRCRGAGSRDHISAIADAADDGLVVLPIAHASTREQVHAQLKAVDSAIAILGGQVTSRRAANQEAEERARAIRDREWSDRSLVRDPARCPSAQRDLVDAWAAVCDPGRT